MDRFVAILWDTSSETQCLQSQIWSDELAARSPRWLRVLDLEGLRVYSRIHRGPVPVLTQWENGQGTVLGVLFKRGREQIGRVRHLEPQVSERILKGKGAALTEEYWGNYLAIWRDPATQECFVQRDPCGGVPCFHTNQKGLHLFFAHTDDIVTLSDVTFSADWNYLRAFLEFNYYVTPFTGVTEISEILPGQRAHLLCRARQAHPQLHWAWDGRDFAARRPTHTFQDAVVQVRTCANACFSAWGTEYNNILVSVSGGLDSSILLALLRRHTDAQITGLHYLGVGYEGFEAPLAHLIAQHCGVPLKQAIQDPAVDNVQQIVRGPALARPRLQVISALINDAAQELADHLGADAFMIGQGGDNLFLQRAGAGRVLTDCFLMHGFSWKTYVTAYSAATLRHESIWSTICRAVQDLRHTWQPYGFLNSESWNKYRPTKDTAFFDLPDEYKIHPWFSEAAYLPPGKADHLVSIVALYNYYVDYGRGLTRDVVYPLFAQPIVEWSLQTPTFLHAHNGVDRAIEREAFADLLPAPIALRTAKGGANAYLLQVMRHNIDFYRDLILNGQLIERGWIDRKRIEHMLSLEYLGHGGGGLFIYLVVAVEAWLHTWKAHNLCIHS